MDIWISIWFYKWIWLNSRIWWRRCCRFIYSIFYIYFIYSFLFTFSFCFNNFFERLKPYNVYNRFFFLSLYRHENVKSFMFFCYPQASLTLLLDIFSSVSLWWVPKTVIVYNSVLLLKIWWFWYFVCLPGLTFLLDYKIYISDVSIFK